MPTDPMLEYIQHVRALLMRHGAADGQLGMTDGQLLENFINHREHASLEALMARHSAMVWGVCRRILHNHHDAEDAFQATFLVLIRKAESIVPRELVGNWLYGVAYQTAMNAKALAAKRHARERQGGEVPEPQAAPQDMSSELQALLDLELSKLPDRYRAVVVLCDLEGKTRQEVVRQFGVPDGTVAGRLARARTMLAKRLARHGVIVSGAALGVILAEQGAMASVPTVLLASTIKAAGQFAAGQATAGAVSPNVIAITRVVMKGMLLSKLKIKGMTLAVMNFILCSATMVVMKDRQTGSPAQGVQLEALHDNSGVIEKREPNDVKNRSHDSRPNTTQVLEKSPEMARQKIEYQELVEKAIKAQQENDIRPLPLLDDDRNKNVNVLVTISLRGHDGKEMFILIYERLNPEPGEYSLNNDHNEDNLRNFDKSKYLQSVMDLLALKANAKDFSVSILGESKVGENPVVIMGVASQGNPDVKLFFEKNSFLLLKAEYRDQSGIHTVEIGSYGKTMPLPNLVNPWKQKLPNFEPWMVPPGVPAMPKINEPFVLPGHPEFLPKFEPRKHSLRRSIALLDGCQRRFYGELLHRVYSVPPS